MLKVAIVGSGPAAFYTIDALKTLKPDCQIDVFERLPSPFGLIRYGVAPDHQSTKAILRKFDQVARKEGVRYFGNVTVGADLDIGDLTNIYDALVVATGAPLDRELEIPGNKLRNVIGSAAFVGWYNGHPDFSSLAADLRTTSVVVVGLGNVALDIARVLAKTSGELADSDIANYAASALRSAPIKDIYIVGRRGPADSKFTPAELREFGDLSRAIPLVDSDDVPREVPDTVPPSRRAVVERNLNLLHAYSKNAPDVKPVRIHFRFFCKPEQVLGNDKVVGLKIRRTRVEGDQVVDTNRTEIIPCNLIVAAIGYRSREIPGLPFDPLKGRLAHEGGRVAPGVFAVGWAGRSPNGTIASNRVDAEHIAKRIVSEVTPQRSTGPEDVERLLSNRGHRWVTYADWQKIDRQETQSAVDAQPRSKLLNVNEMMSLLEQ